MILNEPITEVKVLELIKSCHIKDLTKISDEIDIYYLSQKFKPNDQFWIDLNRLLIKRINQE